MAAFLGTGVKAALLHSAFNPTAYMTIEKMDELQFKQCKYNSMSGSL